MIHSPVIASCEGLTLSLLTLTLVLVTTARHTRELLPIVDQWYNIKKKKKNGGEKGGGGGGGELKSSLSSSSPSLQHGNAGGCS